MLLNISGTSYHCYNMITKTPTNMPKNGCQDIANFQKKMYLCHVKLLKILIFMEWKSKITMIFQKKNNKILTDLNHPTVFDTNTDMLMILQSMNKNHQRADITIFYKGICIQNILDWNKDIFTIITEKEIMQFFLTGEKHMIIMKTNKNYKTKTQQKLKK